MKFEYVYINKKSALDIIQSAVAYVMYYKQKKSVVNDFLKNFKKFSWNKG